MVEVNGSWLRGTIRDHGKHVEPSNPYMIYVRTRIGEMKLVQAGDCQVSLRLESRQTDEAPGLRVAALRLVLPGAKGL